MRHEQYLMISAISRPISILTTKVSLFFCVICMSASKLISSAQTRSWCVLVHFISTWFAWTFQMACCTAVPITISMFQTFLNRKFIGQISTFVFLWPCIMSKAWGRNTNKMQQYRWFIVNYRCWLLTNILTCFEHLYAHRQEKRPRVTACGVFCWQCWMWLVAVLWCYIVGCEHCEGCCRVWALWRLL